MIGLRPVGGGCLRCGRYHVVGKGVQSCGCPPPRGDGFGGPKMEASVSFSCRVCGPLKASWNNEKRRREVRRADGSRHRMRQCEGADLTAPAEGGGGVGGERRE